MTIESLLALGGIFIAILAIADPIQRKSILLFIPRVIILFSVFISLLLYLFCWQAIDLWEISMPTWMIYTSYILSIIIPILTVSACYYLWQKARLTAKSTKAFSLIIDTALREEKYDEIERILSKNLSRLDLLSLDTLTRIFDRKIIRALLDSRSYLHLELLAQIEILDGKSISKFLFVDNVVRELVLSANSPWRSEVIWKYGGYDSWIPLDEEQEIVNRTLQNPAWYTKSSAHMPLLMAAIEPIQSGRFDIDYNKNSDLYESRSGISLRANCPVFLAMKMEVLAINAAVQCRSDEDLYVSDLGDLFRIIRDHSIYDIIVWNNKLANQECSTPYAYLLHEIFYDIRSLILDALNAASPLSKGIVQEDMVSIAEKITGTQEGEQFDRITRQRVVISEPVRVDRQIAQTWSYCVWVIANAKDKVSESFQTEMIKEYLNLLLQLHCNQIDMLGWGGLVEGLKLWEDIFLAELKLRFAGLYEDERRAITLAIQNLDIGKSYVIDGREWLSEQLKPMLRTN